MLYGLMTQEINYSYEGGVYGELIRNRTFNANAQDPVAALRQALSVDSPAHPAGCIWYPAPLQHRPRDKRR